MNTLQERLIFARKQANKTQLEVAEAVGMSQPNYSQLEKGKVSSSTALPSIAEFLKVDSYWLQTGQYSNNLNIGDNNNIQDSQIANNLYNLSQNISAETYQEQLSEKSARHLKDMPQFDIDDAVKFALNPNDYDKLILDSAERTGTFIPSNSNMFGIKLADDIHHITPSPLNKHDTIIIEPKIPPRNGNLVLLCLDYNTEHQRGMLARLKVELDNSYKIKYDDTDFVDMPKGSLICGVAIKIKRMLIENNLIQSRLNQDWDILSTLQI